MPKVVIDSSAYLALLWKEKGFEVVQEYSGNFVMSSVNAAEVFTKMLEKGPVDGARAQIALLAMTMEIVPFDVQHALDCAELRAATRISGLSLGDRACLGLAKLRNAIAVTADQAWSTLDLGIEIKLIR